MQPSASDSPTPLDPIFSADPRNSQHLPGAENKKQIDEAAQGNSVAGLPATTASQCQAGEVAQGPHDGLEQAQNSAQVLAHNLREGTRAGLPGNSIHTDQIAREVSAQALARSAASGNGQPEAPKAATPPHYQSASADSFAAQPSGQPSNSSQAHQPEVDASHTASFGELPTRKTPQEGAFREPPVLPSRSISNAPPTADYIPTPAAPASRTPSPIRELSPQTLSPGTPNQSSIEAGRIPSNLPPEGEPTSELDQLWGKIQEAIQARIQREQFETWFRRAALIDANEQAVCIAVQNGFTRDWLNTYYRPVLEQAVSTVLGSPRRVEFHVDPELMVGRGLPPQQKEDFETVPPPAIPDRSAIQEPPKRRGLLQASDTTLNPGYLFDNFVVGPCNRFAHAASVGVSESPGTAYNPFFLHGSVGLGKTHLLQSLCQSILHREPDTRILYLSSETFINHFIGALENGDLQKFRTKYRNVDVLVVDDIHLLANKERTQEEFFHTFNTLYNAGKQIVLSSDSPPKEIPTLQGRLVSRFKWGLVTEIEQPCYETRMAILKRKSRTRGMELPDEVARLLAEHIDENIRELEGAVVKLIGYSRLAGKPISSELARECLRDIFIERTGPPSMDDILRVVTERMGVKLSDLQSRKRTNAIAYPRQIGMFLARRLTRLSLEEIGGYFGGRDHSTVLHAIKKIERLSEEDSETRELVGSFHAQIQMRDA